MASTEANPGAISKRLPTQPSGMMRAPPPRPITQTCPIRRYSSYNPDHILYHCGRGKY